MVEQILRLFDEKYLAKEAKNKMNFCVLGRKITGYTISEGNKALVFIRTPGNRRLVNIERRNYHW